MTLAQRVRDQRYAKGWGPDELASRASISRTALYQIESGKTEQPRAGTLRRIAEALSITTETLLGLQNGLGTVTVPWASPSDAASFSLTRPITETREESESIRISSIGQASLGTGWMMSNRERDLERKFTELLRSPLGEALARIVEESFRLLPSRIEAIR
jgi:transcriptional regulator with XRE-family HTH domain